jgi:shikimate kinase
MTLLPVIEFITSKLDRPIAVVGMMGSGKSTLGAALANLLGFDFYDTDRRIEQETGQTISQIFSEQGESAFRAMEQATIAKLLEKGEVCVIATGGGSITLPATADMIFNNTLSLWIHAPLDLLVTRTARHKNRPLLENGNPEEILRDILEKRADIYKRAAIHIETDEKPVIEAAERALRQIKDYLLQDSNESRL